MIETQISFTDGNANMSTGRIDMLLAVKVDALPTQLLAKLKVLVLTFGTNQQFKASAAVGPDVTFLLTRMQNTDPNTIDDDNNGLSWGHYQYSAGTVTMNTALTDWSSIGSVRQAFELVAAGLTICIAARYICCERQIAITIPMLADSLLDRLIDRLTSLWQKAGGVSFALIVRHCSLYSHLSYRICQESPQGI